MNKLRQAFTEDQRKKAKIFLAAKVASMMGRKFEEGDWNEVYCGAKGIPEEGWSNLHIDVNHNGLGVEFKMLRIAQLRDQSIKSVCGTSRMHPAATRSIRIDDTDKPADDVMRDVLSQYAALMEQRSERVREKSPDGSADMRFGWLLWENDLREFLYFEESMEKPNPETCHAVWHETQARGARKPSKSLWIYENETGNKRYSVTTSAGIKIQPYFDVPPPDDKNLVYFRVQSESVGQDTVLLWVTAATATRLRERLGAIDKDVVSEAVLSVTSEEGVNEEGEINGLRQAVPIPVSKKAFDRLIDNWQAVSDEHRVQLFIRALEAS